MTMEQPQQQQEERQNGGYLIWAPMTPGELVDRITILTLKCTALKDAADPAVREAVDIERQCYVEIARLGGLDLGSGDALALAQVNRALWAVEDRIRREIAMGAVTATAVSAREIVALNGERSWLRHAINAESGATEISEIKIYGGQAVTS